MQLLWTPTRIVVDRPAECFACFAVFIARPGYHAMTADDRLICDSCASMDTAAFLQLQRARNLDAARSEA